MKNIPLTRGRVAVVDDADYEWLSAVKWTALHSSPTRWYAQRMERHFGVKVWVTMHRCIMQASSNQYVDHIDCNGLNNTRSNLRICSATQNCQNVRVRRNKVHSPYKGVTKDPSGVWVARINIEKHQIHLGRFGAEMDAAFAYDTAARRLYGEFARVNFPTPSERGSDDNYTRELCA